MTEQMAVMPMSDYEDICESVRAKTGGTAKLKSAEVKPAIDSIKSGPDYTVTVNSDNGAVVNATKGALVVSGTVVDGSVTLSLPEAGEWTISAVKDSVVSNTVTVVAAVDYSALVHFYDEDFASNDWAAIIDACQKNLVPASWVVGNSRKMPINGTNYVINIIDKGHDEYADGSGKAPLTLEMAQCYNTTYKMNASHTNVGGFDATLMKTQYIPSIIALMPAEVQVAIREVKKYTSAGNQSTDIVVTAEKGFLLSEVERYGDNPNSAAGEGTQYEYYAAGNTKVKKVSNTANMYYERSPYIGDNMEFCVVKADGTADKTWAAGPIGVSIAFCF